MSAECDKCGTDLVGSQYGERGLYCRPCDLERQLAEAHRLDEGRMTTIDRLMGERDEVQGKFEAVREVAHNPYCCPACSRILRGSKEESSD